MQKNIERFLRNDSGVVLADFVMLTAAITILAITMVGIAGSGAVTLSEKISLSQAEQAPD